MRRDQVSTLAWACALSGIAALAFRRSAAQGALAQHHSGTAHALATWQFDSRDAFLTLARAIPETYGLQSAMATGLLLAVVLALAAVPAARGGRLAGAALAALSAWSVWGAPERWLTARWMDLMTGWPVPVEPTRAGDAVASEILAAVSEPLPDIAVTAVLALTLVPSAMLALQAARPKAMA